MKLASKVIFGFALLSVVVGFILSEPTILGRWHPLIGDSMILGVLAYIVDKQIRAER